MNLSRSDMAKDMVQIYLANREGNGNLLSSEGFKKLIDYFKAVPVDDRAAVYRMLQIEMKEEGVMDAS